MVRTSNGRRRNRRSRGVLSAAVGLLVVPALAVSVLAGPVLAAPLAASAAAPGAIPSYAVAAQASLPAAGSGVAVDPARGVVYVAGRAAGAVFVYDEATLTLLRTIPVADQPYNIAVGPTGVVYVTQYTGNDAQGSVSVIQPGAGAVAATLPTGLSPVGLTISHDGTRLWVANYSSMFLSVYDLSDPVAPVRLPDLATPGTTNETVTESADGSLLYLPNSNNAVHVVDSETGAAVATWATANGAHQVTFTTDGGQGIVSTQLGTTAPVFSTQSNAQAGSIPVANSYYQSQDTGIGATFITLPFTSGGALGIVDSSNATLVQTLTGVPAAYYTATDPVTQATFVTSLGSALLTKVVPAGPEIVQDPADQTVPDGQAATFTASSIGGEQPVTARWQVSTDDGATFADVPGATATSYTFAAALAQSGARYRVVFTDLNGVTAISSAATLTVTPVAPRITQNPAPATVSDGDTATFTAAATGSQPLTVHWQVSTDGGAAFADIPGATGLSYTTEALARADDGARYRAVFANEAGSATTAAALLTVEADGPTPTPTPTPTAPTPTPSPTTPGTTPDDSGRLASTGSTGATIGIALGLGALLMGAGVVLVVVRRRRRSVNE